MTALETPTTTASLARKPLDPAGRSDEVDP